MTDYIRTILETYIKWLNHHGEVNNEDYRYKIADFTKNHGWIKVELDVGDVGGVEKFVVVQVYDGDEGGPAVLYAWLEWGKPYRGPKDQWNIQNLVQTFDTFHSSIVNSYSYQDPRKED